LLALKVTLSEAYSELNINTKKAAS